MDSPLGRMHTHTHRIAVQRCGLAVRIRIPIFFFYSHFPFSSPSLFFFNRIYTSSYLLLFYILLFIVAWPIRYLFIAIASFLWYTTNGCCRSCLSQVRPDTRRTFVAAAAAAINRCDTFQLVALGVVNLYNPVAHRILRHIRRVVRFIYTFFVYSMWQWHIIVWRHERDIEG